MEIFYPEFSEIKAFFVASKFQPVLSGNCTEKNSLLNCVDCRTRPIFRRKKIFHLYYYYNTPYFVHIYNYRMIHYYANNHYIVIIARLNLNATKLNARLSARVSALGTEMKIEIHAPNKLTNRVYALRMKLYLKLRVKFAEMNVLFREKHYKICIRREFDPNFRILNSCLKPSQLTKKGRTNFGIYFLLDTI